MNMPQVWTIIGIMGGSLIGLVTAMFWLVTVQGSRMSEGFAGLRNEFSAGLAGLRNEMVARFDHVETRLEKVETRLEKVETIDREVHALTLKVFGEDPPRSP
jgi:hypothetical protein